VSFLIRGKIGACLLIDLVLATQTDGSQKPGRRSGRTWGGGRGWQVNEMLDFLGIDKRMATVFTEVH
jgi:hypothetical protein